MPKVNKDLKLATVPLTKREVWVLLRALALAAESDRTPKEDLVPIQWLSQRLLRIETSMED